MPLTKSNSTFNVKETKVLPIVWIHLPPRMPVSNEDFYRDSPLKIQVTWAKPIQYENGCVVSISYHHVTKHPKKNNQHGTWTLKIDGSRIFWGWHFSGWTQIAVSYMSSWDFFESNSLCFTRLGPYDKILLGPPCTLETTRKPNARHLFGWTRIVW